jgi:outer membrane protein OmpA-like peptidoglycan-associated protein
MRKILSVLLLGGMIVSASAQSTANYKRGEISKWSVAVKAGLTYDMVLPQSTFGQSLGTLLPGVSLDYTFNPIFGLGLDASNLKYKRSIAQESTFDVVLFGSTNLSNLFSPVRNGFWKNLNIYANLGGGLGFYDYVTTGGQTIESSNPLMLSSLLAEYSLSRNWAVGLEGQYRYYMDFNQKAGVPPINGFGVDGIVTAVSLRYKFGSSPKPHTRDVSVDDYYVTPTERLADMVKAENDELKRQLDAIRADNDAIRQRLNKVEGDVKEVKNAVDQQKAELAKLKDTHVAQNIDLPEVLFQFQTNKLTAESNAILDNVVSVLQNNVFNSVTLKGHTDNIGTDEYNQGLGMRRATAVKEILTSKGIPASKIQTQSYGETVPKATNATAEGRQKNRRVEFDLKR